MNGRNTNEAAAERIRDLAAVNRHHVERMRWLITQMSDEELKRLGLDESNRNADDWLERVLHRMDEKLNRFMHAHHRLLGIKPAKTVRLIKFLNRFQANLRAR